MVDEPSYKLKKLLAELEAIRGRHTELVTVYVPAGYSITDIINQLKNEQGTAENIKSKTTRKNVVDALEKAIQHLKLYKKTPEHGLAVFSGNVSEHEGVTDIKVWAVEPPDPLRVKLYWCDQVFRLEPLRDMVKEKEVYGLVVIDTNDATIGLLKGKSIQVLRRLDSIVPGKTSKGGQSAQRFERVRAGLLNDWMKEVAEQTKELMPKELIGIVVGGPGPIKNRWLDEGYLPTDIKKKVLAVQDTGYADEHGLEELVERAKEVFSQAAVAKERALVQKFLEHLMKNTGLAAYGINSVVDAVEKGAVDTILVSEEAPYVRLELEDNRDHGEKRFVRKEDENKQQACKICGERMGVMGRMDATDALKELAEQTGAAIEVISKDTREGEQLLALGGVAAILRYRL
ncbi:MAG: peptide chain release factor aRF-1 [Candidatus Aenigmatarchaeota archaeon]